MKNQGGILLATSIFIARLIGPALLVSGMIAVFNPKLLVEVGREAIAGRAFIFFAGIMALVAGLAIVNTHNVWTGWPIIITLFGWISLIAGIVRMAFPGFVRAVGEKMVTNETTLRISGASQIALGAFLTYQGYL